MRADPRIESLYRSAAPWPRLVEAGPALGLALLVFWKTRAFLAVWPCYAYVGYLLLDLVLIPQRRLTKSLRNGSVAVFVLLYAGWALPSLGLPRAVGAEALVGLLAGAASLYLREKARTALAFTRGLVVAVLLEMAALYLTPSALGPQLALPLYAAAFAWGERTLGWRGSAPMLGAYALFVPLWLGGRGELLPHAVAGLLAWMATRFLPGAGRISTEDAGAEGPSTTSLGLRDEGPRGEAGSSGLSAPGRR